MFRAGVFKYTVHQQAKTKKKKKKKKKELYKEKGFVCVEGLLDDELAGVIYAECKEKFWDCRHSGAMRASAGPMVDGYGCWVPNPPRRGTSPELHHALRVLFGLPHEIARHGYPKSLKLPTMAYLGCLPAHDGFADWFICNFWFFGKNKK